MTTFVQLDHTHTNKYLCILYVGMYIYLETYNFISIVKAGGPSSLSSCHSRNYYKNLNSVIQNEVNYKFGDVQGLVS